MLRDKKAQMSQMDIFTFMIFAFLVVLVFAGWIYMTGKINDVFQQVGLENEKNADGPIYVNMSEAADDIFGHMDAGIQSLKMVALVYILGLAVVVIITNSLMKVHPIWFFAYVLITLLAVITAPQISNAYESLIDAAIYEGELNSFSTSNVLLLNLPLIVMIVGLIGGIFLFINLIRVGNETTLQ